MRTPAMAVACLLMLAACATPAAAQPTLCNDRADVLAHLANKYSEAPVAIGVTNGGGLVEVLATGDGSTWTIIVTLPNGTSCLVAAGEGWRALQFDAAAHDPQV